MQACLNKFAQIEIMYLLDIRNIGFFWKSSKKNINFYNKKVWFSSLYNGGKNNIFRKSEAWKI